jgi:hypothetical protein
VSRLSFVSVLLWRHSSQTTDLYFVVVKIPRLFDSWYWQVGEENQVFHLACFSGPILYLP